MTKNSSAPPLLTHVRAATHPLHQELENCYPFNSLLSPTVSGKTLVEFFTAMRSVFRDLLDTASHPLLEGKKQALDRWVSQEHLRAAPSFSTLSLRYVFLGSLMGGGQVISRNTAIQELGMSDYFRTDKQDLLESWQELIRDMANVISASEQEKIVEDCKNIFAELLRYSRAL